MLVLASDVKALGHAADEHLAHQKAEAEAKA